jgi:hypothetical protein
MAQNYTRQSSFADGDTITASLFNNEFNQVVNAFSYSASSDSSTGHKHDGTAGQGGNIPKIGDIDFLNKIVVDSTNNRWGIFVEVAGGPVEQVRIQDGAIVPVTTNDIDLGTSALQFKDIFIDGTANIDSLVLSSGSTVTAILDEDDLVSDSATALATQQSIKAYVDAQVTAQDLDIVGDTGTDAIDLDSETLTFTGGTGITSVVTAGTVTHNIDSTVATLTGTQTLTNKSLTAPTLTGTAIVASLDISGDIDVDGTTNLDVVDIDGAVDFGSTTAHAGNATFADNAKAIFGAGSDLQIYHVGGNSYVLSNTGSLVLRSDSFRVLNTANSEQILHGDANGAVSAYYDNALKLATTATGIDVTGTVTADGLTVQTTNGLSAVLESANSYQHLQFKNSGYTENYIDFTNRDFNITCDNVNRFTINGTTGAATFSGSVALAGSSGGLLLNNSATADNTIQLNTTGGTTFVGANGSAGNRFIGSSAYAATFGTTQANALELATNNTVRMTISSTGAATFGGNILLNGSGNPTVINKTSGAGNNPLYRLQADTNYWDMLGVFSDADDTFRIRYNDTDAIKIANNGDISFYEDTGTTAKLFWDASAESLGIGTSSPAETLHVAGAIATTAGISGHGANRATFSQEGAGGAFIQSYGANNSTMGAFVFRQASSDFSLNAIPLTISATGAATFGGTVDSKGQMIIRRTVSSNEQLRLASEDGIVSITAYNGISTDRVAIHFVQDTTGTDYTPMVIDASGSVGIGVVPIAHHYKSLEIGNAGSQITGRTEADTYFMSGLYWSSSSTIKYAVSSVPVGYYNITNGAHSWNNSAAGTAGNDATINTAMTLDASGNLLVGCASLPSSSVKGAGFTPTATGTDLYLGSNTTTGDNQIVFYNPNGLVGSISTSASATQYNTSSDERLKENITDANDAGDKIDAIKVRQYDWKADGSHQDYGMVAQELMTVAPEAVSVPEDPEQMMGVDYSKLVPMMLKEIQSLRARISQLEGAN